MPFLLSVRGRRRDQNKSTGRRANERRTGHFGRPWIQPEKTAPFPVVGERNVFFHFWDTAFYMPAPRCTLRVKLGWFARRLEGLICELRNHFKIFRKSNPRYTMDFTNLTLLFGLTAIRQPVEIPAQRWEMIKAK
jgi:hypothetical protein